MNIGCDHFNKDYIEAELIKNFQTKTKTYDIIVASWTNIYWHMRNNSQECVYIIHQPTDNSRAYKKLHNTECFVIGDGIGVPDKKHLSSPWSRFFWMGEEILPPNNINKHWVCLMSKSRPHRNLVEQWFAKNIDIFDVPNYYVYDQLQISSLKQYMFRDVIQKHNYFKHTDPNFPHTGKNKNWADADLFYAYKEAKAELVTETESDIFFVTEKTIKPIRAGIPFVMIGCKNFLTRLHRMGFKTFAPFIDETYDQESDLAIRIDMACKAFKNYITASYTAQKEINAICIHNQARLLQIRKLYPNFNMRLAKKVQSICKKTKVILP